MSLAWAGIPEPQAENHATLTFRDVACMANVHRDTMKFLVLTGQGPEYNVEVFGEPRYTLASAQKWLRLRSAVHTRLMASYGRTEAL